MNTGLAALSFAALLAALLAVTGCGGDDCVDDIGCPLSMVCVDGSCAATPARDSGSDVRSDVPARDVAASDVARDQGTPDAPGDASVDRTGSVSVTFSASRLLGAAAFDVPATTTSETMGPCRLTSRASTSGDAGPVVDAGSDASADGGPMGPAAHAGVITATLGAGPAPGPGPGPEPLFTLTPDLAGRYETFSGPGVSPRSGIVLRIDAAGDAVAAFSSSFTIPPLATVSRPRDFSTIPRTEPLELGWNAESGEEGQFRIQFDNIEASDPDLTRIICDFPLSGSTGEIPVSVLSRIPAGTTASVSAWTRVLNVETPAGWQVTAELLHYVNRGAGVLSDTPTMFP